MGKNKESKGFLFIIQNPVRTSIVANDLCDLIINKKEYRAGI